MNLISNPETWYFANQILYKMCKENPLHNQKDVIIGKAWLIGNAYSVQLARRKTNDKLKTPVFFQEKVYPALRKTRLDSYRNRLLKLKSPKDNLKLIFEVHKKLSDASNEISSQNRSFASKYLHFHYPNLFYIYFIGAEKALRRILRTKFKEKKYNKNDIPNLDKTYSNFCMKALFFATNLKLHSLTIPRKRDNLLLAEAENML
jgi:hypothetical protein